MRGRTCLRWATLATALGVGLGAGLPAATGMRPSFTVGLDHVPVAVGNLEAASARYAAMGFALKPGRPHDNGLTNRHVKFANGTEVELITAPSAVDDVTAYYRRLIAEGDGGAFLALHPSDADEH